MLVQSATAMATLFLSANAGADDGTLRLSSQYMAPPLVIPPQLLVDAQQAPSKVTPRHIDEYHALGVTKVAKVVSQQWIDLLRKGCEQAQDEAGEYAEYLQQPTDAGIFFTDLELARRLPLYSAFCLQGPAAAIAGTVMQSNEIQYLYDQLFVKEPGVSTHTPWHQDGGYWTVQGPNICSVFVSLDAVAPSEGLQFVAKSQTWPLHNPQHFVDGTPYRGTSLPPMPDIDQLGNDVQLLEFGLEPGDVLVFSSRTVHGGPGNWGRALSTRWVGDGTRYWDRPGQGCVPTVETNLKEGDLLSKAETVFPRVV
jgi:ectoine hydroxylase-related dioxygenase (phytanoyl-CoA dioxygenase family)